MYRSTILEAKNKLQRNIEDISDSIAVKYAYSFNLVKEDKFSKNFIYNQELLDIIKHNGDNFNKTHDRLIKIRLKKEKEIKLKKTKVEELNIKKKELFSHLKDTVIYCAAKFNSLSLSLVELFKLKIDNKCKKGGISDKFFIAVKNNELSLIIKMIKTNNCLILFKDSVYFNLFLGTTDTFTLGC